MPLSATRLMRYSYPASSLTFLTIFNIKTLRRHIVLSTLSLSKNIFKIKNFFIIFFNNISYVDTLSLSTLCPVDTMSCRRFVLSTLCPVDALSCRHYVLSMLCLSMLCPIDALSVSALSVDALCRCPAC